MNLSQIVAVIRTDSRFGFILQNDPGACTKRVKSGSKYYSTRSRMRFGMKPKLFHGHGI